MLRNVEEMSFPNCAEDKQKIVEQDDEYIN